MSRQFSDSTPLAERTRVDLGLENRPAWKPPQSKEPLAEQGIKDGQYGDFQSYGVTRSTERQAESNDGLTVFHGVTGASDETPRQAGEEPKPALPSERGPAWNPRCKPG